MTGIRLGYACVNTQLTTPARPARLATVTDERIAELVDANLGALEMIVRWNRSRGIQVSRLTSNLIPFGSHPGDLVRSIVEYARACAISGARSTIAKRRVGHPRGAGRR
jgi:UV DNA damage repair endonuclease